MGIIKGGLFVGASILLFLCFLVGNIFLTLSLSLEYETVQPELISVIENIAKTEINLTEKINSNFEFMELYCQNYSEFVFSQEGHTFIIPCETVSQGSEAVLNQGIDDLVKEIYYQEYDCNFWDCFQKTERPFFLVSEKAQNYWSSKFYFALIVSIILIGLMFLLIENRLNLLIVVGSLLTIASIPFMKFNWALAFISNEFISQFFTIFFIKSYTVFLTNLIFGIIILGAGITLRILYFDSSKKKFSKNEVKEIVEAEISKSKQKKRNK